MNNATIKHAIVCLLLAVSTTSGHAAPAVANDLVLADVGACKKPAVAPPPPIKEGSGRYNVRRRYIDLDGSGTCVVVDFWVERLGDTDAWGMRTLGHSFRHFFHGKWVPFETELELFPYLLRSPSTGQTYLVAVPDTDMDDILGGITPAAYMRGKWETNDPTMIHWYYLVPVEQGASQIYRALAEQLAKRTPADKQTEAERAIIQALQSEAGNRATDPAQAPAQ